MFEPTTENALLSPGEPKVSSSRCISKLARRNRGNRGNPPGIPRISGLGGLYASPLEAEKGGEIAQGSQVVTMEIAVAILPIQSLNANPIIEGRFG
jgi:hypothetical protein